MRIRFWGVRGTIPTPGPDTVILGGNTPCVEVRTADNKLIIIDAGSGIRRLGIALAELHHPGGCLGFRIEDEGSVFSYCTDTSHEMDKLTEGVLTLSYGADVLVHDAQYTLAQRQNFPDYGHSSWAEAAQAALEANVKQLVLFHYDPDASDEMMETVLAKTKKIMPNSILAKEDLTIDIPTAVSGK